MSGHSSSADMLKHNCKKVSRANLKEGDLVFFRTGKGRKKEPCPDIVRFTQATDDHTVRCTGMDKLTIFQIDPDVPAPYTRM